MASRKSKRQTKRTHPYISTSTKDSSDPTQMNIEQLEDSLTKIGIKVPKNIPKTVLRKLLIENMNNAPTDRPQNIEIDADFGTTSAEASTAETGDLPTTCTMRINNALQSRDMVSDANTLLQSSQTTSLGGSNIDTVLGALTSVTQCFSNLQETVTHLLKSQQKEKPIFDVNGFTLHHWYSNNNNSNVPNIDPSDHSNYQGACQGVRSDSFTNVDIVSPTLQKQIQEGKDVNLAALLIPNYECPQKHTLSTESLEVQLSGKPDPRLNRSLSISEFLRAFGKFKRVMTSVWPDRRAEFDAYEDDIIDIHNFYGSKFYEYHKIFSAKAAAILREKKRKVDWSKRDRDILALISAGAQVTTCKLCNSVDHTTPFCHLQLRQTDPTQTESKTRNPFTDRYGRPRFYHEGKEICNNFNGFKGCPRPNCTFAHVCSKCKAASHSQNECARSGSSQSLSFKRGVAPAATGKQTSEKSQGNSGTNK